MTLGHPDDGGTSETSVNFYQTTCCCESLKSHKYKYNNNQYNFGHVRDFLSCISMFVFYGKAAS
jgi:hypothetical protein